MATFEKKQGESLSYLKGLTVDGVPVDFSTDDWTCRLVIKPISGGLSGTNNNVDRNVPDLSPDNYRFVVKVTRAEMAALPVGQYYAIAELESVTNDINAELTDYLTVTEQGAV